MDVVWLAEHVPITSRIQPCSRYAITFPTLYLKEDYNKHIAESCVSRADEWTVTESHSIAVAYEVPTAAALNAPIASRSCETADSVAAAPAMSRGDRTKAVKRNATAYPAPDVCLSGCSRLGFSVVRWVNCGI